MARRERTTGLPRQPRQVRRVHTGRTFLGIPINDATIRLGVLGFAGALLIVVTGIGNALYIWMRQRAERWVK